MKKEPFLVQSATKTAARNSAAHRALISVGGVGGGHYVEGKSKAVH